MNCVDIRKNLLLQGTQLKKLDNDDINFLSKLINDQFLSRDINKLKLPERYNLNKILRKTEIYSYEELVRLACICEIIPNSIEHSYKSVLFHNALENIIRDIRLDRSLIFEVINMPTELIKYYNGCYNLLYYKRLNVPDLELVKKYGKHFYKRFNLSDLETRNYLHQYILGTYKTYENEAEKYNLLNFHAKDYDVFRYIYYIYFYIRNMMNNFDIIENLQKEERLALVYLCFDINGFSLNNEENYLELIQAIYDNFPMNELRQLTRMYYCFLFVCVSDCNKFSAIV